MNFGATDPFGFKFPLIVLMNRKTSNETLDSLQNKYA